MNNTGAREDVLNFYKALPFNAFSSPEAMAEQIQKENDVKTIYPAEEDLYNAQSVLELGCGAGWLANSIAYWYGANVTAVDFNPVAIDMAEKVADILGNDCKFYCADLFSFETKPHDIVISNGVLHHTTNWGGGVKKCIDNTIYGGKIFVGLYHKYGRKPFLDYFKKMKEENASEDFMMKKYLELDSRMQDTVQARSWFLDQVLHPFETQHTLKEVMEIFKSRNVSLLLTSINGYEKNFNLEDLYEQEKKLYDIGMNELKKGKYYPGFFYVLGEKG